MTTDGQETSPRRLPWRRRAKVIPLFLAFATMMTAIGAAAGVPDGTPGTAVPSEQPSLPPVEIVGSSAQAEDHTFAPAVELQRLRDRDGTLWRAITRDSNEGRCIEVEAVSTETDQRLGMLGGCGLPDVVYEDAIGFRSARGEQAILLPIAGQLATGTVLFGAASCHCDIRTTFSDGRVSSARARRGFYLVHIDGVGAVPARVEALDEAGHVLTSHELPAPPETPLGGVVDGLLDRAG